MVYTSNHARISCHRHVFYDLSSQHTPMLCEPSLLSGIVNSDSHKVIKQSAAAAASNLLSVDVPVSLQGLRRLQPAVQANCVVGLPLISLIQLLMGVAPTFVLIVAPFLKVSLICSTVASVCFYDD